MSELTPQDRIARAEALSDMLQHSAGFGYVRAIIEGAKSGLFEKWLSGKPGTVDIESHRVVICAYQNLLDEINSLIRDGDEARLELQKSQKDEAIKNAVAFEQAESQKEIDRLLAGPRRSAQ